MPSLLCFEESHHCCLKGERLLMIANHWEKCLLIWECHTSQIGWHRHSNSYGVSHGAFSCEKKKSSLIFLCSIHDFLAQRTFSQRMVAIFKEQPHHVIMENYLAYDHSLDKALLREDMAPAWSCISCIQHWIIWNPTGAFSPRFVHAASSFYGLFQSSSFLLTLLVLLWQNTGTFLISFYTYWGLRTLTYLWLSHTSSSLSRLLSRSQANIFFIWFSPKPIRVSFSPPGTCLMEVILSSFLNCQCCLNFIDAGKCSVFLWAMVKKYPCTVPLRLSPFLKMTEFPFWTLKAVPGLSLVELLGRGKPMTDLALGDPPHF